MSLALARDTSAPHSGIAPLAVSPPAAASAVAELLAIVSREGPEGLAAQLARATRRAPPSVQVHGPGLSAVLLFRPTPEALVALLTLARAPDARVVVVTRDRHDEACLARLAAAPDSFRLGLERVRVGDYGAPEHHEPRTRALFDLTVAALVAVERNIAQVIVPICGGTFLALDSAATTSLAAMVHDLTAMLRYLAVPVALDNPFAASTLEDVLGALPESGRVSLGETSSCVEAGAKATHHCGACTACLERRCAVLALGLEAHDPLDRYALDPLLGARAPEPRARAELQRALAIAPDAAALSAWTQAAAVLPGELGANLDRVIRFARRRSEALARVVDRAIARHAGELRRGTLPRTCLLVEVVLAAHRDPPDDPSARPVLRRAGDVWEVRFGAAPSVFLPHARGFDYLRELVMRPRQSVSSLDLRSLHLEAPPPLAGAELGALADPTALARYRARLHRLRAARGEAEDERDEGRLARIDSEVEALERELARTLGLGGRVRPSGDAERARKAVTNAIRAAMVILQRRCPDLHAHLARTVRTGQHLAYEPDDDVAWST